MSNRPHLVLVSLIAITVAVASAVLLAGSDPAHRRPGGGASAGPETEPAPPEPRGAIISPAGKTWRFGETDHLGYQLPLDVRRPRPRRPLSEAPDRVEILKLRAQERVDLFEEHRLSPDDGHTQNETAIDADGDTVIAAFHIFTNTSLILGVSRSVDGGHAWTAASVSDFHTALTDPCVKSAGGGRWILSYLASGGIGGSDYDVFVRASTDGGLSWGNPVAATSDANFDDKPYCAARGNEVLVGYADFGFSPAKVRAVRSTNGGASFDHDVLLANNSVGGNGACPIIDPSGVYHIFWRDSFQDSLWVSHSSDHGVSWSPDRGIVAMSPLPSQLPPGFRMVNLPSAAVDPTTGTIVVVWNDQRFGNADILSIRSTDGGVSWTEPIRVNDDAGTATQFFPWIAVDSGGVFHVCWYDRREDGFDIDVYYARSADGGAGYEPNVRVTAQAYTPVLPWDTSLAFIGDYNGIAANGAFAFPCYQDAREGNQDVYVALVPSGSPAPVTESAVPPGAPPSALPSVFIDRVLFQAVDHPGSTVSVFASDGRRVREVRLSGAGTGWWDGHDESGGAVPSGVYFARLSTGGAAARLVKRP